MSELAQQTAETLQGKGGWVPLPDDTIRQALVNPTNTHMSTAIENAFAQADSEGAQLLLAFVGHGVAQNANFYLMAADSPAQPNSQNAFLLGTRIQEYLGQYRRIDGLVLLVDACQAGVGLEDAAAQWPQHLSGRIPGRLEMLAASNARAAYDGCFTKTILRTMSEGRTEAGDTLSTADMISPLLSSCTNQKPGHFAYNGGAGPVQTGTTLDPGLYLVPNPARPQHVLTNRPAAGLVDQVTKDTHLTKEQRRAITRLTDAPGRRLRALTGPAGCGKTTIMSFLIRPTAQQVRSGGGGVRAAVFLDASSTPASIATELNLQLFTSVEGFATAHKAVLADQTTVDTLDAIDRDLILPLRGSEDPERINIVIDGLDQVSKTQADNVYDAIARLTREDDDTLEPVKVILGARNDLNISKLRGLEHTLQIPITPPTWKEARATYPGDRIERWAGEDADEVPGGWIAIRLAAALDADASPTFTLPDLARAYLAQALQQRENRADRMCAVVALLAAAGTGPILPFIVLQVALEELGLILNPSEIRDELVSLGPLIQRGNPGDPTEQDGISHIELVDVLAAAAAGGV